MSENEDDFDNFRKWQRNFRSSKTGKSHGKVMETHGISKAQKITNPEGID